LLAAGLARALTLSIKLHSLGFDTVEVIADLRAIADLGAGRHRIVLRLGRTHLTPSTHTETYRLRYGGEYLRVT
jgi:hypothetical protein